MSGTTELPPPIDISEAPANKRQRCSAVAGVTGQPVVDAATPTTSQAARAQQARSAMAHAAPQLLRARLRTEPKLQGSEGRSDRSGTPSRDSARPPRQSCLAAPPLPRGRGGARNRACRAPALLSSVPRAVP